MAELRNDPAHDFLEVQVTEPAVFLRASPTDEGGWSGALIRGVLTLTLANAVPISSVEVKLGGYAETTWEEDAGEGPGRIERSEEYTVYSASTVLFSLAPGILTCNDENIPLDAGDQPYQNQETAPSYTVTERSGVACLTVSGNDLLPSAENGSGVQPNLSSTARLDAAAAADQAQEARTGSLPEVAEENTTEEPHISTAISRSRSLERHVPIARDHDRRGGSPSESSVTAIAHVFDSIRDRARRSLLLLSHRGLSLPGSMPIDRSDTDQLPNTAQERSQPLADTNASQITTDSPSCCTALKSNSGCREMFQRGVYNYPFCFTLPPNMPPTTRTEYGSFTWRLNAVVKRNSSGSRSTLFMAATRVVEVVYNPVDDESEETAETWKNSIQLQRILDAEFLCTFSFPRNFGPMGGKFPVQFDAMSLSMFRVFEVSVCVYLYEFTKYYDRLGNLVRKEKSRTMLTKFGCSPILLPTFQRHPWLARIYPFLPDAMQGFHASTPTMNGEGGTGRNPKSNVRITHIVEVRIRVERKDQGVAAGREHLRDLFIREPIMMLSPLCTARWTALPKYPNLSSSHNQRSNWVSLPFLPRTFQEKKRTPERMGGVSGCGELYERLVSGHENETEQAPPKYGDCKLQARM
ncbi:hypothetical protein EDD16DRAFT_1183026 [Pisolithus croceorrhizus]|nr:hypothetical protein EDD16DRAFT_1183026 [Pisolithus croceorrhizus]